MRRPTRATAAPRTSVSRFCPTTPAIVEPHVDRIAVRETAVKVRSDPGQFRDALMSLQDGGSALFDVAERSSWHPNGFAKVVLQVGAGWSVRLHVWRPIGRSRVVDAKPHGHRWEFASWIIAGVLRETTFLKATSGERFDVCDYSRHEDGSAYLSPRGTATLKPEARFDHLAGMVYGRSGAVLHTAEPVGDGLVASLVFRGKRSPAPAPVYLRPGTLPIHQEMPLSVGHVGALLRDVAAVVH